MGCQPRDGDGLRCGAVIRGLGDAKKACDLLAVNASGNAGAGRHAVGTPS